MGHLFLFCFAEIRDFIHGMYSYHFQSIGPLDRCFHRVAMSVYISVCLSVCPLFMLFFLCLSLALRSHNQFKASDWSTLLHLPFFGGCKAPWRRQQRCTRGGVKKKRLKSFWAAVLLSASVERFFVSCMRDFFFYT